MLCASKRESETQTAIHNTAANNDKKHKCCRVGSCVCVCVMTFSSHMHTHTLSIWCAKEKQVKRVQPANTRRQLTKSVLPEAKTVPQAKKLISPHHTLHCTYKQRHNYMLAVSFISYARRKKKKLNKPANTHVIIAKPQTIGNATFAPQPHLHHHSTHPVTLIYSRYGRQPQQLWLHERLTATSTPFSLLSR